MVWIYVYAPEHVDPSLWFVARRGMGEGEEGAAYQVIRYKNKLKEKKCQNSLCHRIIMKIYRNNTYEAL